MNTSRVAQRDRRAGGSAESARRKMVISYPKRRVPARRMPVKYHHSLRKPRWGPSSAGNVNGRGARAAVSAASDPDASDKSRETARGEGEDEDEDEDGAEHAGARQARTATDL